MTGTDAFAPPLESISDTSPRPAVEKTKHVEFELGRILKVLKQVFQQTESMAPIKNSEKVVWHQTIRRQLHEFTKFFSLQRLARDRFQSSRGYLLQSDRLDANWVREQQLSTMDSFFFETNMCLEPMNEAALALLEMSDLKAESAQNLFQRVQHNLEQLSMIFPAFDLNAGKTVNGSQYGAQLQRFAQRALRMSTGNRGVEVGGIDEVGHVVKVGIDNHTMARVVNMIVSFAGPGTLVEVNGRYSETEMCIAFDVSGASFPQRLGDETTTSTYDGLAGVVYQPVPGNQSERVNIDRIVSHLNQLLAEQAFGVTVRCLTITDKNRQSTLARFELTLPYLPEVSGQSAVTRLTFTQHHIEKMLCALYTLSEGTVIHSDKAMGRFEEEVLGHERRGVILHKYDDEVGKDHTVTLTLEALREIYVQIAQRDVSLESTDAFLSSIDKQLNDANDSLFGILMVLQKRHDAFLVMYTELLKHVKKTANMLLAVKPFYDDIMAQVEHKSETEFPKVKSIREKYDTVHHTNENLQQAIRHILLIHQEYPALSDSNSKEVQRLIALVQSATEQS